MKQEGKGGLEEYSESEESKTESVRGGGTSSQISSSAQSELQKAMLSLMKKQTIQVE